MRSHCVAAIVVLGFATLPGASLLAGNTDGGADAQGQHRCPADMVPVDTFCIDRYEYPNKLGQSPRNFVSYIEAQNLCLSQGKRLCTTQEWTRACSGPLEFQYPYGNEFVEGACNLATTEVTHSWTWYGLRQTKRSVTAGQLAKSGSLRHCVSGYGAWDMLGNLWEWTDSGVVEHAILMGGSWATPSDTVSCSSNDEKAIKGYAVQTMGFRCCRGLSTAVEPGASGNEDVQESPE